MTINTIIGTEDGEDLSGSAGVDNIRGRGGNDAIDGYAGADFLYGDAGDDLISAGDGDDRIYGGDGNDRIWASIVGGSDVDTVRGGSGDDQIALASAAGGDVHGGAGFDTLILELIAVDDPVAIAIRQPGGGAVTNPNGLRVESIEALSASTGRGDDTISGANAADFLVVRGGANTVHAWAGDDFVSYFTGAANAIDGGSGSDTVRVTQFAAGALQFAVAGTSAGDNFGTLITHAERFEVYGGDAGDQATLGAGNDVFLGGGGDDSASGRGGSDMLDGGDGNDSLSGGGGEDRLLGREGDDLLAGGAGRDLLLGAAGNDTLIGGEGRDVLRGGLGADSFRLQPVPGAPDVLRDMTSGEDTIEIDSRLLGGVLADGAVDADRFATGSAIGAGAQFVFVASADGMAGHLYWDLNGELAGGASLLALVYGSPALSADDILIF